MRRTLISLATIPIVYFALALSLSLLPVSRSVPERTLDFDVLDVNDGGTSAVEEHYLAKDGKALFYRKISGRANIVVILLHGSGTEGRYLITLGSSLNTSVDATVIIPDLRGHGESAFTKPGDIEYMGQYIDDIHFLKNHLRRKYPDSVIVMGGHSSGGGLAVKYAGISSHDFDGYLLLAPYLGYEAPTVRPNSGGLVQVSIRRYIGLSMLDSLGITALNHVPVLFFNRPESVDDFLQLERYSYRLNESFSPQTYREDLQANKQPVLLLVGSDDDALYAEKFSDVVAENAPHAELHIIPGVKHLNLPNSENAVVLINQVLEAL